MKRAKESGSAQSSESEGRKENCRPQTSAGKARAEGLRLFKVAGRPSKQDFVKVYDPNGPKMTWEPFKTSTTSDHHPLKLSPCRSTLAAFRQTRKEYFHG